MPTDVPAAAPNLSRKRLVVWIMIAGWGLGGALGLLMVGLKKGGFLTLSNVGDLPQLAHVQQQLRPLAACGMEYATRDKRGQRQHFEYVFVEPCDDPFGRVLIKVNQAWGYAGVGFELTRGDTSAPWKILVEKDEVPFDQLLAALDEIAPQVASEFARLKGEQDASRRRADEARSEHEAAERARKERAKTSYPE